MPFSPHGKEIMLTGKFYCNCLLKGGLCCRREGAGSVVLYPDCMMGALWGLWKNSDAGEHPWLITSESLTSESSSMDSVKNIWFSCGLLIFCFQIYSPSLTIPWKLYFFLLLYFPFGKNHRRRISTSTFLSMPVSCLFQVNIWIYKMKIVCFLMVWFSWFIYYSFCFRKTQDLKLKKNTLFIHARFKVFLFLFIAFEYYVVIELLKYRWKVSIELFALTMTLN